MRKTGSSVGDTTHGHESWELRQVVCGDMHSAALTWAGALYAWGSNARGQLGIGSLQDIWTPKLVRMPMGKIVKQLACGREHCLAVTIDCVAYAWGKGDKGQLGIGRLQDSPAPKQVQGIIEVIRCAAGEDHSGAICRSDDEEEGNALYMWGSTEMGKLGLGTISSSDSPPTQIKTFSKSDSPYRVPVSLSCGQYHTAVVCSRVQAEDEDQQAEIDAGAGRVWTFGGGWFGRLGHNDMENQLEPKLVNGLGDLAKSVHCASYHTCVISYEAGVLTETGQLCGEVWVWGRNRCICEHEHVKVPVKFMQIDLMPYIQALVTVDMNTWVVTQTGAMYGWGDNRSGQLMLEASRKDSIVPEPMRITPHQAELFGAGPSHVIMYTRNKQTFGWGNQSCGRLGLKNKQMQKKVIKPLLVNSEWSSIEAVTGGAQEPEEEEDGQQTSSAALASLADTGGREDKGSESESEDAPPEDAPDGTESATSGAGKSGAQEMMLNIITSGQKIQQFSTMQKMLKEEPDVNKAHHLKKQEKELGKQLSNCLMDLMECPDLERRVELLHGRIAKGYKYINVEILKKLLQEERTPEHIGDKISAYQDLLSTLQVQTAYLEKLAMSLTFGSPGVFLQFEVVTRLFNNLWEPRVKYSFLTFMKMVASREIGAAKNYDDLFQDSSRFVNLFRWYVLHPVHYSTVVASLMDNQRVDDDGHHATLMGRIAYNTTEKGSTWALEFDKFITAPTVVEQLKEKTKAEVRIGFNRELDNFKDFMKEEAVAAIRHSIVTPEMLALLVFCKESMTVVPKAVGQDDDDDPSGDAVEMVPIFRVMCWALYIPVLSDIDKWGGRQVGFLAAEKLNFDPDVRFNIQAVLEIFEGIATNNLTGKNRTKTIAKRFAPWMLKWLGDQMVGYTDVTETHLTVSTLTAHYSRVEENVYIPSSMLMKFSNLLLDNFNKIRFGANDYLEKVLSQIGRWSDDQLELAEERQEMEPPIRIAIKHRWLFKERSIGLCPMSRCSVPLKLNSGAKGDSFIEEGKLDVKIILNFEEDNEHKALEDLFGALPPLKATNCAKLKEEFEAVLAACESGRIQNETLAAQLKKGIEQLNDCIQNDIPPEELITSICNVVLARSRQSKYLEAFSAGMARLKHEQERHRIEVIRAEAELDAMADQSKEFLTPAKIRAAGAAQSMLLKGDNIAKDIERRTHAIAAEEKKSRKIYRTNLEDYASEGKVKLCTSLEKMQPERIYLTLWSSEEGLNIHIGLMNPKTGVLEFVKKLQFDIRKIKELSQASKDDTVDFPFEGPPLMKWKSNEFANFLKLAPPLT